MEFWWMIFVWASGTAKEVLGFRPRLAEFWANSLGLGHHHIKAMQFSDDPVSCHIAKAFSYETGTKAFPIQLQEFTDPFARPRHGSLQKRGCSNAAPVDGEELVSNLLGN